ncbi:MAG: hypothetical protein ACK5XA_14165, partial [Tagaea sp.]
MIRAKFSHANLKAETIRDGAFAAQGPKRNGAAFAAQGPKWNGAAFAAQGPKRNGAAFAAQGPKRNGAAFAAPSREPPEGGRSVRLPEQAQEDGGLLVGDGQRLDAELLAD